MATAWKPTNASQKQRYQQGRQQRQHLGRAKLGQVRDKKRNFDPVELLLRGRENRVAKLLPLKYSRMCVSPFAFFRGAASLMAADLGQQANTELFVQLCGDAHIQNLGCFGAPDGRIIFDINDFDETIHGPWEWDIKRMAVSIVLAGLEVQHPPSACASAVECFVNSYCESLQALAREPVLVAARNQIHQWKSAQPLSAALQQAQRANISDLLKKYTERNKRGQVRFKTIEQLIWKIPGSTHQQVLGSLSGYQQSLAGERLHLFHFFHPVDVAFKVVGTGSVGLRDYLILMEGNGTEDYLFLQVKQEASSVYAPYLKNQTYAHQGRRVAEGQRRFQPLSDLLLGWTKIRNHDYLVRQLNDHKGRLDLAQLKGEGLATLAGIAGQLLANGHTRSGDALMITGYIGDPEKVVKAIAQYALEYAAFTQADFESFQKRAKPIMEKAIIKPSLH